MSEREPSDTATLPLEDVESPEHAVRRFHLQVLSGADEGRRHASKGSRTILGTHESADFQLRDPTVSRFHCEIEIVDGVPVVRDLDSRNGTVVDGVQVAVAYLEHGANLLVGQTRLRFEIGAEQNEIPLSSKERFGLLVGTSASMRAVFARLERAAESDTTILLQGETGTGKDATAHSIHQAGSRESGPLVVVDCGAIPDNLLESELFGHEKGAFTGAMSSRAGAFENASGGTLFLDEIGELALELQPKLLRAIESREIKRVGGSNPIRVDIRLIAATNRNLRREVNAGRFRSDLYYRLAVLEVEIPPLRDHKEDIPILVDELLGYMGVDEAAARALRTSQFLGKLLRHSWPGNIRELRNYLERCLAMQREMPLASAPENASADAVSVDISLPLRQARERWVSRFEREYLERLLREHGGNVSATARAAGVNRVYVHRLLGRHGLR